MRSPDLHLQLGGHAHVLFCEHQPARPILTSLRWVIDNRDAFFRWDDSVMRQAAGRVPQGETMLPRPVRVRLSGPRPSRVHFPYHPLDPCNFLDPKESIQFPAPSAPDVPDSKGTTSKNPRHLRRRFYLLWCCSRTLHYSRVLFDAADPARRRGQQAAGVEW
eukprot:gene7505-biopygen10583